MILQHKKISYTCILQFFLSVFNTHSISKYDFLDNFIDHQAFLLLLGEQQETNFIEFINKINRRVLIKIIHIINLYIHIFCIININKMSSGNLSYPCKGFRQAKNFVSHYNSQYIISIQVYQTLCQNILLKVVDANHCFTIYTLTNGLKFLIQRDINSFSVSTQPKSGSYIGSSKTYLSLKDLFQKLQSWCQGTAYDVVHNNCYHLCAKICYILNSFDLRQKVNQANKKVIDNSTNIIQNVLTGTQMAVTNGVQLAKGASLVSNVTTVTNTAKGIQSFAKVYQSSQNAIVQSISNFVIQGAQKGANAYAKASTKAMSSTVPVVGCLIGEVISNGIEMHKEGWKQQAVAKGVGNIAVGTAGGYGGFVGGAQLGAYVGAFSGPVGIAIGGAIGGIVGSIGGSWGIKKIMPWNW